MNVLNQNSFFRHVHTYPIVVLFSSICVCHHLLGKKWALKKDNITFMLCCLYFLANPCKTGNRLVSVLLFI